MTYPVLFAFEGCAYCHEPKKQKIGCCHENHFEKLFMVEMPDGQAETMTGDELLKLVTSAKKTDGLLTREKR